MAAIRIPIVMLVWATLSLCTSCGLTLPKEEADAGVPNRNLGAGLLEGSIEPITGGVIDLEADAAQIQVLMFVSETCSVCRAETQAIVQDRAARGVPTNVVFYSVLVGSVVEDAADWRDGLGVDWTVALDAGDPLFRTYCPELQTPCSVLRNPTTGAITTLTGEHSLSEWEEITGTWTY